MMQALLDLGADPAARTPDGSGAVLLATSSRSLEAVRLVVSLGLDVNVHPEGRSSALHTAIRFGADDLVEFLAAHGADFDARDAFGRTPLEEAEFEAPGHTIELVRRLVAERARQAPR
jgi:ankyrin repeat protein